MNNMRVDNKHVQIVAAGEALISIIIVWYCLNKNFLPGSHTTFTPSLVFFN